jgi:hypothetical protein
VLVLSALVCSLSFSFSSFPNPYAASRVKDLFPEKNQLGSLAAVIGNNDTSAASLSSVRTELMTTKGKDVEKLLNKYSLAAFKEGTVSFWRKLRRVQEPTNLEKIMQDIDEGKIKLGDSEPPGSDLEEAEVAEKSASAEPSTVSTAERCNRFNRRTSSEPSTVSAVAVPAPLVMSAWDLRKALVPGCDPEADEATEEWNEIHSQTHPDIQDFLKRKRKDEPHRQAVCVNGEAVSKTEERIRKKEVPANKDGEEARDSSSLPKRHKHEPAKGGSGTHLKAILTTPGVHVGGAGGKARASAAEDMDTSPVSVNLGDTEEEEEEEEDEEPRGRGGAGEQAGAEGKILHPDDKVRIGGLNWSR